MNWLLFATACLTVCDATEIPSEDVASFTELISSRESARESESETLQQDDVGEMSQNVVVDASRVMASVESTPKCEDAGTTPRSCSKPNLEQLNEQVVSLTNQLSKSVASFTMAKQREEKLALLEREKYCYVKTLSDKVMMLVDNVKQAELMLTADTGREREYQLKIARIHRTHNRASRRLQVINRLLAGAEVGMVHLESDKKLNTCNSPELKKQS